MKSIIHVIDSLKTGGAETLLVGYLHSLNDFRHTIITFSPKNDFESETKGYEIICLNYKGKHKLIQTILMLRKIIKSRNADILHAHLFLSIFIGRLACPSNVKFIFSMHITIQHYYSKYKLFLERLMYTKNQIFIGVSETVKNDYDKFIKIKGEAYVLPNYVDDKFFEVKRRNRNEGQLRIIAIGHLKPQKNYFYILECFKELRGLNVSLDIYGDGPLKDELQALIEKERLQISLKGQTDQIYTKLPDYDLFIMPSWYEGWPVSLSEAMASGLPAIVSDIPVLREVTGGHAIFINPNNPSDLKNKIIDIMANKYQLEDISLRLRARAVEISGKKNYIELLRRIYLHN